MAQNKKQKHKQKRMTVLVTIALAVFVVILFGRNAVEIHRLNQEEAAIQDQIASEKDEGEQLDEDLKQIGSKSYIESMARKYLGLYYPDEKIVKIIPGNKAEGVTEGTPDEKNDQNPDSEEKDNTAGDQKDEGEQ